MNIFVAAGVDQIFMAGLRARFKASDLKIMHTRPLHSLLEEVRIVNLITVLKRSNFSWKSPSTRWHAFILTPVANLSSLRLVLQLVTDITHRNLWPYDAHFTSDSADSFSARWGCDLDVDIILRVKWRRRTRNRKRSVPLILRIYSTKLN